MRKTVANQVKNPRRSARSVEIPSLASGWQIFKYGKLGELTENIRTFALPFENQPYTFKMQYEYDSWNRIQKMTYPDGEEVYYEYNLGGMLEKVYGQVKVSEPLIPVPYRDGEHGMDGVMRGGEVPGIIPMPRPDFPFPTVTYTYNYIDSIAYNEFELKRAVFYGNGTHAQYTYDSLQRLETLKSYNSQDFLMQDISYSYDSVSNITGISNAANYPGMNLGGTYSHSYEYDDLYRLTYSTGTWKDRPYHLSLVDTVRMAYHKNGRIARKNVFALTMSPTQMGVTNYNRRYDYSGQRNTLSNVYDSVANTSQNFSWDKSGNMVAHNGRSLTWTEDNRLQTVADNSHFSCYQYDAGGDRTYKLTWDGRVHTVNGRREVYYIPQSATLYASPYLVATPQGYTKHYYAGAERITSQLGRGRFADVGTPVVGDSLVQAKLQAVTGNVRYPVTLTAPTSSYFSYLDTLTNRQNDTFEAYWYHTDHLGSSSWITYSDGSAVQHLHYLPFGEDFVNKKSSSFEGARYTFSAKEKDAETKYSYFGARYYFSELSIWLSVDPQSDKYPSLSPYVYCADNPIKLVDPNGEEIWIVDGDCSYKYLNGKLYTKDGSEYTAKENSFAYKTVNSLNQIKNGGEVGNAMISELESSTLFSVNIIDAGEGKSAYNNGTIRWNTHGQEVPTTVGIRADALMGLAHELAHGVDEKRGTFNTEKTKDNSWIGNHEWKAVYTENQIRMEQGKPFRTHYEIDKSDPSSPKGSDPKMINTANRITNFRLPQGVSPLF